MVTAIDPEAFAFGDFHTRTLPRQLSERSTSLPPEYAASLRPIAIGEQESGTRFTYRYDADRGGILVEPGDGNGKTIIDLPRQNFAQLTQDLESAAGLVYGEHAKLERGDLMDLLQWEPAFRWMFCDRPVYDPAAVELRNSRGELLDPSKAFSVDDEPEEMADYLRSVGYLWVRNVIPPDEIEALRAAGERLRAAAREGDQESWWGRNEVGESVLCRVLRAGQEPGMRALHGDPRLERFAALADVAMEHKQGPEDKDGVTLLWKQPGVAEGLGDLPWHRDCGMGGHASMCPTAVLSVFLGPNTPEAGQIRFLPGSWKSSFPFVDGTDAAAPVGVGPPAQPGDITFHYGDGLHVAPPPTGSEGPFRSCVLLSYARTDGSHHLGGRHYNDVLLGSEDGQVKNMREMAKRED